MVKPHRLGVLTLTRTPDLFARLAHTLSGDLPADTLPIVVDNAVNPAVAETALHYGWACVEPGRNLSFSEGNNLAARVAAAQGCSHLLLLNDDVIPDAGFVGRLWDERPDGGVLGAVFVHEDGTVNHAGALVYPDGRTDHMGRGDALDDWQENAVRPVVAATFAGAMVPIDLWQELGGLDARYLWGWEDTDFCLRAVEAGGTNAVHYGAVGVHGECGTRPRGGRSDLTNMELFLRTWQDKLPGMLRSYFARVPGVRGIVP